MDVICFRAKVPYECGFRRENSVNTHSTYPIPPFTTWTGLIGNALGLAQDEPLPFQVSLAVTVLKPGNLHQSLTLIHKRAHPSEVRNLYQSTLVTKERLYFTAYDVAVSAPEMAAISTIYEALLRPARPLYLGSSDDMVDICDIRIEQANKTICDTFDSVVPFELGRAVAEAKVVQLPLKFEYNPVVLHRELFYWSGINHVMDHSIPDESEPIRLESPAIGYQIGTRVVCFVPC